MDGLSWLIVWLLKLSPVGLSPFCRRLRLSFGSCSTPDWPGLALAWPWPGPGLAPLQPGLAWPWPGLAWPWPVDLPTLAWP
jgi:hypothetical protein